MKKLTKAMLLLWLAPAAVKAQTPADSIRMAYRTKKVQKTETGVASFYHRKFEGRPTASGELYAAMKYTAAHNYLPFGTKLRVTNLRNKRSVVVTVNDRLHHRNTRLVDLSYVAASDLGFVKRGLTKVRVELLEVEEGISMGN